MGELPPYSDRELLRLIDRATVRGIHRTPFSCVVVLEEYGTAKRMELEIRPEADVLEGNSDELSVYVRGSARDD